jgi:hypothetical protein
MIQHDLLTMSTNLHNSNGDHDPDVVRHGYLCQFQFDSKCLLVPFALVVLYCIALVQLPWNDRTPHMPDNETAHELGERNDEI